MYVKLWIYNSILRVIGIETQKCLLENTAEQKSVSHLEL